MNEKRLEERYRQGIESHARMKIEIGENVVQREERGKEGEREERKR